MTIYRVDMRHDCTVLYSVGGKLRSATPTRSDAAPACVAPTTWADSAWPATRSASATRHAVRVTATESASAAEAAPDVTGTLLYSHSPCHWNVVVVQSVS